ncbi:MAG: ankyrin repeat domain-containing protein, partial [Synergistaceae bacterium]|nr:ankyrin repeat domain-containing protein [Synergistaceae bacterium]
MSATDDLFRAASTKGTSAKEIMYLIRQGANVKARTPEGITVLMGAAACLNCECVQLLIDAGAEINARTTAGFTALMMAARYNNDVDVTHALIYAGAD